MSSGVEIPASSVRRAALQWCEALRPYAESPHRDEARVELAGSLRRDAPTVRDVEIVAEVAVYDPSPGDLFGAAGKAEVGLAHPFYRHAFGLFGRKRKGGPRFLQFAQRVAVLRNGGFPIVDDAGRPIVGQPQPYGEAVDVPVDLFVVRPPASWGVIFAIRTGPWEFSRALVTRANRLGMAVIGGALYRSGQWTTDRKGDKVPRAKAQAEFCDTERDFFDALRLDFVPPEIRGQVMP